MSLYQIKWKKSAVKELQAFPKEIISNILNTVDLLSENPYPNNSMEQKGTEKTYRIRITDYRIIYTVHKNDLIIQIIKVGHRKDIYKKIY